MNLYDSCNNAKSKGQKQIAITPKNFSLKEQDLKTL